VKQLQVKQLRKCNGTSVAAARCSAIGLSIVMSLACSFLSVPSMNTTSDGPLAKYSGLSAVVNDVYIV
jgi:hypothetical protein